MMNSWEGASSIVGALVAGEAFFGVVSDVVAAIKRNYCPCECECHSVASGVGDEYETEGEEEVSAKTTHRITRARALEILRADLEGLSNDALGEMMDALADTRQSKIVSELDNFIVSDLGGAE